MSESDAAPSGHFVLFFPFLRLAKPHAVAGVEFVPLRTASKEVPSSLHSALKPMEVILSGYVDRRGKPFDNCVVATIPDRGWDLTTKDGPTVNLASALLFLASWSTNEYFRGRHENVNSSAFRITGQNYSGDLPHYIAISARRRDGSSLDGGYKHGEYKFAIPTQNSIRDCAEVDEPFLAGLDSAHRAGSDTMHKLESAMRFASLANTDDDLMEINAEAILMASAFDQLLLAGRKSSSRNLGLRFAALFRDFSTATVAEAMKSRPDIEIDSNYAAVQPGWPAHRKWMEELYDARSQGVHKGHHKARTWGWTLQEHLVMAAHVFPMAVKLLLAREGHYQFSEKDRDSAESVDRILAAKGWDDEPDDRSSVWATIMSDAHSRRLWKRIAERMRAESSDTALPGQGKED